MVLWLFFIIGAVFADDFTGHRLVSIKAKTKKDLELLDGLSDKPGMQLDFWSEPSVYQPVDVRVAPWDFDLFQAYLGNTNMTFEIINDNVQSLIDAERAANDRTPRADLCNPLTTYCTFEQIEALLANWAGNNPSRMVLTTMNRRTRENRNIYQVKIAADLNNPKEAIWIEAGTHAREWISVSSALVLIQKLLSNDNMANLMLSNYDWYIAPVHNPDGYVYTHTTSRLWRKNREPCAGGVGTDLNRNWDANFGGAGSSATCFSDTYRGPSAFSASETAALRDAVGNTQNVKAFFSIHCYSQYMLVPYAYSNTKPGRYSHLLAVAEDMMKWLESVDGRYFITGTPPDILYVASGGAYDYFYRTGIPYAYTYELRPASGAGNNGFILDPSQIPVATNEVFYSLWAFARNPSLNWGQETSHPSS